MNVGLIDPGATPQQNNFGAGQYSFLAGLRGLAGGAAIIRADGGLPQRFDH